MIPLIYLLVAAVHGQQQTYVSVPTSQGTVQGKTVNYGSDTNQLYYGQADVFLGIPYAQPPTGDLRFQAPQAMRSYPQQVYDATYYRPKCPQLNGGNYVNEDCLYLNVFTQQANGTQAMAVMVFVDGGDGLTSGGTDQSQMKGTVRNLVSRGVVVVTFQYRLGALGFFSTTAMGFQSNNGMLDQVMVLQWVQQNIQSFGGDPNRVTLCGQGDGACAVNAHTLSPMSQNLFQQAIIQSGTIYGCYSPDGTVPVSTDLTTPMPSLQYDQGVPYVPLDQGGSQGSQYQGYYSDQSQGQNQQYQGQGQQSTNSQGQYSNQQYGQGYQNGQSQYQGNGQNQQYGQSTGYNGANAQYDSSFVNPSQQLAQQLCNISSSQWNSGNIGNLKDCLNNYSVDFIVQTQGQKVATWLIVRDNSFFPGTPEQLASRRPPIPIIIGTVQDEDADYAFKLVANGNASQNEGDLLNNWMVDFARKNKVNNDPQAQSQIENIIAQNYNITPTVSTTTYMPTTAGQRVYDYTGQNGQFQNSQFQNQGQQGYGNGQVQQYNPNQQMSTATVQSLRTMSTITSDSGIVSQTATAIDSFTQNGNTMVRVFQFSYVTDLGRQGQPDLGTWKPVTKGTDQIFLFMSETVWSQSAPSSQDRVMADQMGQQWTQFAKTGQVTSWQPTNGQNYNYCNLNMQSTQQTGYGEQARDVFQQQVQPIVTQSQQQQGLIPQRDQPTTYQPPFQYQYSPQPSSQQPQYQNALQPQQNNQQCCQQRQQCCQPVSQAQYRQNANGDSSFQISFSLNNNNLPNNG